MLAPESPTVRAGLVLFALGLIATTVDVVPFFDGVHNRPLWLNLACLLAPVGLAVALTSALRAGRLEQRAALERTGERTAEHVAGR